MLNMYRIISTLILFIVIIYGCNKSIEPIIANDSDEITLNNKGKGFSFSHGYVVSYPNSDDIIPDIQVHVHLSGLTILGVFLSPPDSFKTTFNLIKEFDQSDSALVFFTNLNEVPDSNYEDLAIPVKTNQIWAVKTTESKYGKILILNTKAYEDTTHPTFRSYYGEVKLKWKYQPNGSRYF